METWLIFLLLFALAFIVYYIVRRQQLKELAIKQAAPGAGILTAAEKIPVYGQIVTGVKAVGRPVNSTLDRINSGVSSGLRQIPVVGTYLAKPNEYVGTAMHKVNDFFGLN
jgi:hypothetical protein